MGWVAGESWRSALLKRLVFAVETYGKTGKRFGKRVECWGLDKGALLCAKSFTTQGRQLLAEVRHVSRTRLQSPI